MWYVSMIMQDVSMSMQDVSMSMQDARAGFDDQFRSNGRNVQIFRVAKIC